MKYLIIALILLTPITVHANTYQFPRCYFVGVDKHYVPMRISSLAKGDACYVRVGTVIKSLGIPDVYEEQTYVYNRNSGFMTYENDLIFYPPTGQTYLVSKDDVNQFGWCFVDTATYESCVNLSNVQARELLENGIVK